MLPYNYQTTVKFGCAFAVMGDHFGSIRTEGAPRPPGFIAVGGGGVGGGRR